MAKAAHGGTLVTLPNDKGFAEILIEADNQAKKGSKARSKPRIIAYFYGSDGHTEMNPGPTDIKLTLGKGETSRVAELAPDPNQAGKFSSTPNDYPDGFAGHLDASVGGLPVGVDVRIR